MLIVPSPTAPSRGAAGTTAATSTSGPAAAAPENAALYLDCDRAPGRARPRRRERPRSARFSTPTIPAAKIVSLIDQQGRQEVPERRVQLPAGHRAVAGGAGRRLLHRASGDQRKGAAVVETTNPEAALAFARKVAGATAPARRRRTYNGASYQADPDEPGSVFGTVGDFLVQGRPGGVQGRGRRREGRLAGRRRATSRTRSTSCPTIASGPSTRSRRP